MKVAIVEDRQEIADSIGRAVDRDPEMKLTGVYYSAEAFLEVAAADRPDIVLMDIGLPKMNGIECMVRAKDLLPATRMLMHTVFDTEDKLFDALRFGADGYILKNEGIIGVMRAIRELGAGGAPMSREMARKVLASMRESVSVSHRPLDQLTPRQNSILSKLAEGKSNREVAEELDLTEGTVKQHVHAIYKALQVANRVEAVNLFLRGGEG
ncbi:response regulator transcription factor [Neolewinella lacunae]|uniref:Response regulator transcription factor n=1 Tax=Neolewinella lacunae TaxID=1517758 RepID=A0A923PK04_9BACT|nr:response regulator transcription factor [Neolewinella lacunae]MBC6995475.1 response regulator transcription factor [Neolewinella lacunae]MDN3635063.1 response regulator transcription factor [Neolewinella lacunae]